MGWGEKPQVDCYGGNSDTVHNHKNKLILDEVGKGDGTKFLSDDGTMKTVNAGAAILNADGGNAFTEFNEGFPSLDGGNAFS